MMRWAIRCCVVVLLVGCAARESRRMPLEAGDGGSFLLTADVLRRSGSFEILADDVPMDSDVVSADPVQRLFSLQRRYPTYAEALEGEPIRLTVVSEDGGTVVSALEVSARECEERCTDGCTLGTLVEENQHLALSDAGVLSEGCVMCLDDRGGGVNVCP